jgi:hypothetical protein
MGDGGERLIFAHACPFEFQQAVTVSAGDFTLPQWYKRAPISYRRTRARG